MTRVVKRGNRKNFLTVDMEQSFTQIRSLFHRLCKGEEIVLVVESITDPEIIFGTYHVGFKTHLKSGLLKIRTIAEMDENDEGTNWEMISGY